MATPHTVASLEAKVEVAVELVRDSVAAVVSAAMRGRSGCRIKQSQQSQTSLAQPYVFSAHSLFPSFFLWYGLLPTGSHHSPSVSITPLPPLNLMPDS